MEHIIGSADLNRDRLRSLDKALEIAGYRPERTAFLAGAAVAGAAVLAVGVWSARRGVERAALLVRVGAWFTTWVLLFSPSTENATFSILGPFVAWAIVDVLRRPRAWVGRVWLAVCLYLMALSTSDASGPMRHFFHTHCAPTFGALMFQMWLITDLCYEVRETRREMATAREAAATSSLRSS